LYGRLDFNQDAVDREGGVYSVEMLDAITQVAYLGPVAIGNAAFYAGGFEAGYFIRKPTTNTVSVNHDNAIATMEATCRLRQSDPVAYSFHFQVYVLFKPDPTAFFVGRKLVCGDYMVYDEDGRLCVYIHNNFGILGEVLDTFKIADLHWQSYAAATVPADVLELLISPNGERMPEGSRAWTDADDAVLTSWLGHQVGSLPATVPEESKRLALLLEQAREDFPSLEYEVQPRWPSEQVRHHGKEGGSGSSQVCTFEPTVVFLCVDNAQLANCSSSLVRVIKSKLQAIPPPTANSPDKETDANVELTFKAEHFGSLYARGTRQVEEAVLIANALYAMIQQHDKGVYRVLELVGVSPGHTNTVFEALQSADWGESPSSVEYFIACQDARSLKIAASGRGGQNVNRHFRVRRVLLTPDVLQFMEDWAFDAMVVGDWLGSGWKAWTVDSEQSEDREKVSCSPARRMLQSLDPLLLPGARMFICGLSALPPWVPIIGESLGANVPGRVAVETGMKEWEEALDGYTTSDFDVISLPGSVIITAQRPAIEFSITEAAKQDEEEGFLIIGEQHDVEVLVISLQQAQPAGVVKVLRVGCKEALDDQADYKSWSEILKPFLEDQSATEEAREGAESVNGQVMDPRFRHIVFIPSLAGDDPVATINISRLTKLTKALHVLLNSECGHLSRLWIITHGVTHGPIRPEQGCIFGFFTGLQAEWKQLLDVRLVDLETSAALIHLRRILFFRGIRERLLGLTATGEIRVRRYGAIARDAIVKMTALPDGPTSYFCDLLETVETVPGRINVAFRPQDLPQPQKGEVTVDVYCSGLNFRDVMVAMSVLPLNSYERSYFKRCLGLESTGIVRALGPGVTDVKVGDRVIFGLPRCFANRVVVPCDRLAVLSPKVSLEDAAALQSVYSTAHYCLVTCANI